MNINLDLNTIVLIATIGATTYAMYRSNGKGFELLDEKISNVVKVNSAEREGLKREIGSMVHEVEKIKDEIFPRISKVEMLSEKNCKGLEWQRERCKELHQGKV